MTIPAYPDAVPVDLVHRDLLLPLLDALQPRVSELSFTNLYLFRKAHNYRLTTVGDSIVPLGRGYDGNSYFLQPLSGNRAAAARSLLEAGETLYGADAGFVSDLGEGFHIVEDRDNADYIYLREELATLPAGRFHKKKNRVNYFLSRNRSEVVPFSSEHRQGVLDFLDLWDSFHENVPSLALELDAAREGVEKAEALGLEGLVVLVDGVVKGYVMGERLNADTSVMHFEKGDPFLDGIYQVMERDFNSRLFTSCRYVNREQDLGEENLRRSKLSYHPVELLMKYRLTRR